MNQNTLDKFPQTGWKLVSQVKSHKHHCEYVHPDGKLCNPPIIYLNYISHPDVEETKVIGSVCVKNPKLFFVEETDSIIYSNPPDSTIYNQPYKWSDTISAKGNKVYTYVHKLKVKSNLVSK